MLMIIQNRNYYILGTRLCLSLLPRWPLCQVFNIPRLGLQVFVVFYDRVHVTFVSWGHCVLTSTMAALDEDLSCQGRALVSSWCPLLKRPSLWSAWCSRVT